MQLRSRFHILGSACWLWWEKVPENSIVFVPKNEVKIVRIKKKNIEIN